MTYLEFQKIASRQPVIDIRNIAAYFSGLNARRLYEWQQKGYIRKITNGFYVLTETPIDEGLLRNIASLICQPSYIGLESALAYYGFIPEAVFQTVSVTTRRSRLIKTPAGDFRYRSIHKELFFGYNAVEVENKRFFISDPEKTLLDMVYFTPGADRREVLEGLRLNLEEVRSIVNMNRMADYLELFSSPKIFRAFRHLREMLND